MESDDQMRLYFWFIWVLSTIILFCFLFVIWRKISSYIGNRFSTRKAAKMGGEIPNPEFSAIRDSGKEPWEIESPGNDSESNLTDTSNNQIVEEISGSFFSRQGFNFVLFVGMILATIIVTDMGDSYQYNDGQEIIYCDENQQIITEEQFRDGNNDCSDGSDEQGFYAIFFLSLIWAPLQYRMIKNSRSKYLSKLRSIKPISKVILQVYIWIIIWVALLLTYSLIDIIICAIVALTLILPAYLLFGWILSPIENYLYKNLKSLIGDDVAFDSSLNKTLVAMTSFRSVEAAKINEKIADIEAIRDQEGIRPSYQRLHSGHHPVQHPPRITWVQLCLVSFVFGPFGIDRLVTGFYLVGILKFFTVGGFGILYIYDFLIILTGQYKDINGYLITSKKNTTRDDFKDSVEKFSGIEQMDPVEAYVQKMVAADLLDEASARQYAEQYYASYYAQQEQGDGN